MLKRPINDWLARNRYRIVCTTVGNVYSGYQDAEGVFLITNIRSVRRGWSGMLLEGGRDKYVREGVGW